ncbi:hypothetical protein KFK09_021516 [Dendrobium nobile]|uniref:C2H2-type domain-containing protein n=1 Tax=Dendrobium nobile TaxID=94219 RepID=A0A8T3AW11_DENNO|nr:hypothetical protein KFK09_021516 [Dendrobium nobile]
MKRFRFYGEEMKESIDSFRLANVLMLLSGGSAATAAAGEVAAGKVFQCKTCNRQFPSFQALGGHRASHKKPRLGGADGPVDPVNSGPAKPRVHECSVCGLEFSIGQALGGHMRRHRAAVAGINGTPHGLWATEKEPVGEKTGVGLDLNLLPPLEVEEVRSPPKLLGFTLTPAIVDCMY